MDEASTKRPVHSKILKQARAYLNTSCGSSNPQ